MALLGIPERFKSGISRIGLVSDDQFRSFFDAVRKAPEFSEVPELSSWIDDQATTLSKNDSRAMIAAAASMARVQTTGSDKPNVFAEDIWETLSAQSPELDKKVDPETFKKRITDLLSISNLAIPEDKTGDLKSEVERAYCDARILTDLRTGFRRSVEDAPSMMVLLHTLRIAYHDDGGDHHEFYVTLDESDLNALQMVVERAKKKANALKVFMKKANITVVE